MLPRIDYDMATRIHADRLKEAEKLRLVAMVKATSTSEPKKNRWLSFRLKRRVVPKVAFANSRGT
jgi:hypothetical protein